jgi:hypothetical protein
VKPLAAALRIQSTDGEAHAEQKKYEPVMYGDFLMKKVRRFRSSTLISFE